MSMKHLYCKLSTIERLTLYLRACGRSDNKEAEAVVSASPRLDMSGPDFFPHVLALEFMIFHHWLSQIDTLLAFISVTLALKSNCAEALALAGHFADEYLTSEIAFKSVCDEYGLDYDQRFSLVVSDSCAFGRLHYSGILQTIAEVGRKLLNDQAFVPVTIEEQRLEYQNMIKELIVQFGSAK